MDIVPVIGNPMGFDEFSSQDFRKPSPPPVRQPDVVWQMPAPSNPGLRTLWASAGDNSTPSTQNAGPLQSNWNMLSADVPDHANHDRPEQFSSRLATHSRARKSTSSSSHGFSLKAFAELTSSDLLDRVRNDADEKARRRAEELTKVKPKGGGPVKRKSSKPVEASRRRNGGILKAGNNVARTSRMDRSGKRKESSRSLYNMMDTLMDIDRVPSRSPATPPRDFRDTPGNLASLSSSLSSGIRTPEDSSMVLDTSFPKDVSLMKIDDSPHTSASSTTFVPACVTATCSTSVSPEPAPEVLEISVSPTPPNVSSAFQLHPLLIKQKEERQRSRQEKQAGSHLQDSLTSPVVQTSSSSNGRYTTSGSSAVGRGGATSGTSTTRPPSALAATSSLPRPSSRPPPLGMRRVATFPATGGHALLNKGISGNDLPTRQRGFRPPLLSSQAPNATGLAQDTQKGRTLAVVTKALTSSALSHSNVPTVPPPVSETHSSRKPVKASDPSSDGPEGGEADSSYGDISFDLDALEETMKKYD